MLRYFLKDTVNKKQTAVSCALSRSTFALVEICLQIFVCEEFNRMGEF